MIPIYVTTVNEEHPELTKRRLGEVFRATHYAMGYEWATKLLPEHFFPSAFRALGYQPRSAKYNRIKDRMFRRGEADKQSGRKVIAGSDTPLVRSGNLREKLLQAVNMIRANAKRVVIDLVGPAYFTLRPWKSKTTILIAREILAVNDRHADRVGTAGQKGYVAKLNELVRSGQTKKVHKSGWVYPT